MFFSTWQQEEKSVTPVTHVKTNHNIGINAMPTDRPHPQTTPASTRTSILATKQMLAQIRQDLRQLSYAWLRVPALKPFPHQLKD